MFGRENEENVARTRSYCGWPSSPHQIQHQKTLNYVNVIYIFHSFMNVTVHLLTLGCFVLIERVPISDLDKLIMESKSKINNYKTL